MPSVASPRCCQFSIAVPMPGTRDRKAICGPEAEKLIAEAELSAELTSALASSKLPALIWSTAEVIELVKPLAPNPRAAREVMRLSCSQRTNPPPRSTRTRINHAFGVSLDTW